MHTKTYMYIFVCRNLYIFAVFLFFFLFFGVCVFGPFGIYSCWKL
jgi:hypothetical protein